VPFASTHVGCLHVASLCAAPWCHTHRYPIDEVTAFLEEELTSHQVDVGSAAPSGAWSAVPAVVAAPHWIAVPGEGDEFIDDYIAQFLNEEEAA